MASFWDRVRLALYRSWLRAQGIEPGPEDYPPPPQPGEVITRPRFTERYTPQTPPEQPTPEEYQIEPSPYEETPPPPPEEPYEEPQEESSGCIEGYYPGRIEGQRVRVKPRFYVDNPDIECIRRLINSAGNRRFYTIIICGVPSNEYPGHEGEESICLGYVRRAVDVIQASYLDNAIEFVNSINALDRFRQMDHWELVESISILDV